MGKLRVFIPVGQQQQKESHQFTHSAETTQGGQRGVKFPVEKKNKTC